MSNAATLDLTNLAADLMRAGQQAPQRMDDLLVDVGGQILVAMRELTPVVSGTLQSSETVQASPGRVVVGPVGVDYAPYVEYGTGTKGEFPTQGWTIKPKNPGGVLAFKMGNRTVFAKSVYHAGSAPHPYARPAAQKWIDSLGTEAARIGVEMITGKTR